ncbi:DUF599 domain-containing protein [Microvirga pudoricolor]|uniref:DUF599 domain-containing protein n=1 Tax=Microvirga pudoricolor TaxID=2778729 RepID=UPI00194E5C4C|nr:DUF599 family protein [Microvirga pudoricolor]MBM6596083.1 DUF599 family protein [Microvirga pudoricolor]
MHALSSLDFAALVFFLLSWFGYHVLLELTGLGERGLNRMMNDYRYTWMEQMVVRENRIVDSTLTSSLQNGTAFFASTSLVALGGVVTLFRSTDTAVTIFADLPLGLPTTREAWEIKVIGLAIIFIYAFFKFAWSYRLFNYVVILVGAVPVLTVSNKEEARVAARRAAALNVVAGKHFNRGQRAFFFALAYLGWFVSAYILFLTTAGVFLVMWRRQFTSDARRALLDPTSSETEI